MKLTCALVGLAVAGWAAANAWWPVTTTSAKVAAAAAAKPPGAGHTPPRELLARVLARLHNEALEHFYSDPRNGLARMPLVYEKVVKEWQTPWFSLGELDDPEPIPFKADMEKIHAQSVHDFFHPEQQVEPVKTVVSFQQLKDAVNEARHWEAKSVDLIGLLEHPQPVAYISEQLADVHKADGAAIRQLDEFEIGGLLALQKGKNLFARSRDGVVRLLGAVRARTECLECHAERKQGDLLGAFSYTLRPAEYRRMPLHRIRPSTDGAARP